jgi:hypothetical protein
VVGMLSVVGVLPVDGPAAGAQVYDEEGREGARGRKMANCRIRGLMARGIEFLEGEI